MDSSVTKWEIYSKSKRRLKQCLAVWQMTAESDDFIIFLATNHNAVSFPVLRFYGDGIKQINCGSEAPQHTNSME